MFEKYGEFGSAKELNDKAKELLAAERIDDVLELAEENGIDKEDALDFVNGMVEEFCTVSMAAIGKLEVEMEDYKFKSGNGGLLVIQSIIAVTKDLSQLEDVAREIRQKGKRVGDIYQLLFTAAHRIYKSNKNTLKNGGVAIGMSEKALKDIIKAYYLESDKACEEKIKTVFGG